MSLKNLFRNLSLLLVALTFLGGSLLAADVYVNDTNGDDLNGDGTSGNPYKTITKALNEAVDGDTIYIAADLYDSEPGPLVFNDDVTVVVETFQGRTDALISGQPIEIDADVSIASTGTNDFRFDNNLTLTSGTLTVLTANFSAEANPILVTVVAGSMVGTPDYGTNVVNVTYNHGAARANSDELPSDLNGGTITNAPTVAFTLTINKAVVAGSLDNSAGENVVFTEAPLFEGDATNGNAFVAVDNSGGGLIDFQAGATVMDDIDNNNVGGSTIQVNDQTLHVDTDDQIITLDNVNGNIISDAASTVGNGLIHVMGDNGFEIDGGQIVSLEIPAVFTGVTTLLADVAVYGDFLLSADQAGAFTDATFRLQMFGDFVRDDDTPGNYVATGLLSFLGGQDQLFDPGASLTLNDVLIDNNNATSSWVVTMDASVDMDGNFTVDVDGMLELQNYNIRMSGAGNQTFTNDGQYLSSPGTGFVIFEGGTNDVLTGAGDFNNIDIRNTTTVTYTSDINFSGILNLRDGVLVNGGAGDTFNLDDVFLTYPDIRVWKPTGTFPAAAVANVDVSTGVFYNLTYYGAGGPYTTGGEWSDNIKDNIYNLRVETTGGSAIRPDLSGLNTLLNSGTVNGTLYIAGTDERIGLGGANFLTLAGENMNHTVLGRVTTGTLVVTGDGSSIDGSTSDADTRYLANLTVNLTDETETFTSSNLHMITGDLLVDGGDATINLIDDPTNDEDAQVGGDVTVEDASVLRLGVPDERDGDDGTLAEIAGNTTLNGGVFQLLTDILIAGNTNVDDTETQLNTFDLTVTDLFTATDTDAGTDIGSVTGDGWFIVDYGVGGLFTIDEDFSFSNFDFMSAGVTVQIDGDDGDEVLTVTDEFMFTVGDFDVNGHQVTFTGSDFTYVAGTMTDVIGGGLLYFNGTTQNLNLNGHFTLGSLVNPLDFELDQTASLLNIVDVTSPVTGPWDFTITGLFTMTNGDIELNTNDLVAQGAWTRVAGNITGGGFFVLDGGNAYDQGTGTFSVERLRVVNGAAVMEDDSPWRIEEYLQLADNLFPGDANSANAVFDIQLSFADDATLERQADGLGLAQDAQVDAGGGINLLYTTDPVSITTGQEIDLAEIYTFEARTLVITNDDFTVSNLITVDQRLGVALITAIDNGGDVISLGANGWVELVDIGGDDAFDDPLNPLGVINVDYDNSVGPINTSNNELDNAFDLGDVIVDGDDDVDDVQAHEALTFGGNLQILDDGDFDMNGFNLTLTGGFTQAAAGTIVNEGALANLWFGGAADWTFDAGGDDWMIGDNTVGTERNYRLGVNTATADVQVTLADGNLDFATFGQTLYLTLGMITTLDNIIVLEQQSDANTEQGSLNTQPTQGFVRTGDSHVVGNIRKYLGHQNGDTNIDNGPGVYDASIALTRVEFPVGAAPTSPSAYRPFALAFNTLPTASTNITVNHVNTRPSGENGMPIATNEGFTITNFSDFYWTMYSDITLQPQVQYDIEARAEGYRAQYEEDEVEDIRFVRKYANNTNNPWVLQGSSGYDNSTDDNGPGTGDDEAVVIAKDAVGAVASQGAVFAYSQNNKAPFFVAALGNVTITEGDSVDFDFMVTDPDIGQTGSIDEAGSTIPMGTLTEVNDTTSNLKWVTGYYDAGVYTYTVRAADGFDTRDTTFTVTVLNNNRPIAIDYTGDSNDTVFVGEGDQLALQFTSTDADTNDTPMFSVLNWTGGVDSSFNSATGLFNYTPDFTEDGMVYQLDVRVADGAGSTADTTAYVAIVKTNQAPVIAGGVADTTINEAQLLQVAYSATDADAGDVITYSVVEANGDSTGAMMVANVFTWTPDYTQAGVYDFWVIATDDGAPNKSDSLALEVTVTDINAAPYFTVTPPADTTIAVGETFTFQYEAEDPDQDVLVFSFGDQYPDNATLDPATGIVTWTPSETAVWAFRLLVTDPSGLYDSTQSLIRALEYTVTVSGTVTYNNGGAAAIEGAEVSVATETDSTDAAGNYSVADIPSGTYTVSAMKTGSTGGILASDALKAALFALDSATHPLNDLAQLAADVNNSGSVTGADAQLILQKVVDNTVVFDRGDWVFTSEEVTLVSTNVVANLQGMVVGDVNGSYTMTPSPALSKDGGEKVNAVTALQSENIQIKPEQEFELPVSYSGALTAGAVTLQFSYPVDKLEFISVKAPVNFVYKDVDGVITLAWADFTGKKPLVVEDSEILVFKFKATDKFSKQEVVNLTLEDKSEIADVDGKVYKSSQISVPGIEQAIPKEFALSQNYPNPFNPSTVINYDLPESGDVKLVVYNMLGEEVTRLVNTAQEAGSYKVQWNAVNFASGVYIYRITVEGVKNFVQTKKMILVK